MADAAAIASYMEQAREFRGILEQALSLETSLDMKDYLEGEFEDAFFAFCEFIGFCHAELRDRAEEIGPQALAMASDGLAMASLMIGWDEGRRISQRRSRGMPV